MRVTYYTIHRPDQRERRPIRELRDALEIWRLLGTIGPRSSGWILERVEITTSCMGQGLRVAPITTRLGTLPRGRWLH